VSAPWLLEAFSASFWSVFETPMTPRSPAGKLATDEPSLPVAATTTHVVRPGVVDRGLEGRREARVREGHVDDVGAVADGVHDAQDDVAVLALAGRVEDGDRHDLDAGITDARDALAVVGRGGDDPGHGGAVAIRVGRAGRAIEDAGARDELTGQVAV